MGYHLNLEIVFITLAVLFVALALRDYLKAEGKLTPARGTWLRIAFIFCGVSFFLYFVALITTR